MYLDKELIRVFKTAPHRVSRRRACENCGRRTTHETEAAVVVEWRGTSWVVTGAREGDSVQLIAQGGPGS